MATRKAVRTQSTGFGAQRTQLTVHGRHQLRLDQRRRLCACKHEPEHTQKNARVNLTHKTKTKSKGKGAVVHECTSAGQILSPRATVVRIPHAIKYESHFAEPRLAAGGFLLIPSGFPSVMPRASWHAASKTNNQQGMAHENFQQAHST